MCGKTRGARYSRLGQLGSLLRAFQVPLDDHQLASHLRGETGGSSVKRRSRLPPWFFSEGQTPSRWARDERKVPHLFVLPIRLLCDVLSFFELDFLEFHLLFIF